MQIPVELRSTEPHPKQGIIDDVNALFASLGELAEFQIASVTFSNPFLSDPPLAPIVVSLDGLHVDFYFSTNTGVYCARATNGTVGATVLPDSVRVNFYVGSSFEGDPLPMTQVMAAPVPYSLAPPRHITLSEIIPAFKILAAQAWRMSS